MVKRPGMGNLGGCRKVPRPLSQLGVVREQGPATAGGDQLVAIEAQGAH